MNCMTCGYDEGLHHSETLQCPKNGSGLSEAWRGTHFIPEDRSTGLEQRVKQLELDLREVLRRLKSLEKDLNE